ncbi:hypothetical protein HALLA_14460 [Halostagnicola larsenii XH-48]|uniref:Uncharacterized protein n=1 Tax=Halostagnicola larsenii XH-48 TaxID=797299 RepID=W0JRC5_9EURY|nr:hypothetical protein HALLA_14460 [Halostagnicola larsenii XH-48]
MRFKPVPEPPAELADVATIRAAVPATPDEDIDCCARLIDRTRISDRDEAATWLTYLRALELATDEPAGFARTSMGIDPERLRTAFLERVVGTEAVLETLEATDRPLEAREVSTRVRSRNRVEKPLERTDRILEWAVLLELADSEGGQYRPR